MILLLLLFLSAEPTTIYFEPNSCVSGDIIADFKRAGMEYQVPVSVVILPEKADYRVQWGRRTALGGCRLDLIVADDTGTVVLSRRMAFRQNNRFKDFFAAIQKLIAQKSRGG